MTADRLTEIAEELSMSELPGDIVGHKTFSDEEGRFRHEPLTRAEADALWDSVERAERELDEKYPTEQDCVQAIFDACQRLEKLGWKRADLSPPDRKTRKTISLGSTGIHDAYCETRPQPRDAGKWWWHPAKGDLWPHDPIYYKPEPPK